MPRLRPSELLLHEALEPFHQLRALLGELLEAHGALLVAEEGAEVRLQGVALRERPQGAQRGAQEAVAVQLVAPAAQEAASRKKGARDASGDTIEQG